MYGHPYGSVHTPSDSPAAITDNVFAETAADVVSAQDQPIEVRTVVAEGLAARVLLTAATSAELLVVATADDDSGTTP
jgi:hypothetical protein